MWAAYILLAEVGLIQDIERWPVSEHYIDIRMIWNWILCFGLLWDGRFRVEAVDVVWVSESPVVEFGLPWRRIDLGAEVSQ